MTRSGDSLARTLLITRNYCGVLPVLLDTMLRGLLGIETEPALPAFLDHPTLAFVNRGIFGDRYEGQSYINDWRDAFVASPRLVTEVVNVNDLLAWRRTEKRLAEYDLIVVLHSATGDQMKLLRSGVHRLDGRRAPLVVFLGNEYCLMPEKIDFVRHSGAEFVASQLPRAAAQRLYAECRESRLLLAPHALNPAYYSPPEEERREIDVGFRGALYSPALGDVERTRLIEYFERESGNLGIRFDLDYRKVVRREWSALLRSWKGTVGAESGTYFLEHYDRSEREVRAYLRRHPRARFEELQERFFAERPAISGKAISSRHFEPIGTKTCQILLEGDYNGILFPDEHYVAVRKDLSDVEEAVRRFRDHDYRRQIADRAWELAMAEHTYAHRVDAILDAVLGG